jgi:PST family polysaccharide transporter
MTEARMLGNTLWRLLPYGVSMVLSLTVGVMMARYLGPENLGSLASVLALTGLAAPLGLLGLDLPAMRELQTGRKPARTIISTVTIMRVIATLPVIFLVLELGRRGAAGKVEWPVLLCATSLLIFAPLHSGTLYFEGRLTPRLPLIAQTTSAILAAAVRVVILIRHGSIALLAFSYAVEAALRGIMVTGGFLGASQRSAPWTWWDGKFARSALRQAMPLLATTLIGTIYDRIGQPMISALAGAHEAGLYAATSRLISLPLALATMLAASFGPMLLQVHGDEQAGGTHDGPKYLQALDRYFRWSSLAALAWMGGLILLSPLLVAGLFGPSFAGSAPLLRWHALLLSLVFMAAARNEHLKATQQLHFQLGCWILTLVVHVGLNFWWIPRYGALGCIWSALVAQSIAALGTSLMTSRNREIGWMQLAALFVPWPFQNWIQVRIRATKEDLKSPGIREPDAP